MKYAIIENNIVLELFEGDLESSFHPEIAKRFTPVPDIVIINSILEDGVWIIPDTPLPDEEKAEETTPPEPTETKAPTVKLTPPEFMLLFKPQERIALKSLRESDVVLNDFFELVEDPRLQSIDLTRESTQSALTYSHGLLVSGDIISAEDADVRLTQILSGTVL